jgi:hypothetical protein
MQLAAGAGVKTVNGSETPDFKNNLEITEIIMEINDLRDFTHDFIIFILVEFA